MKRTTSILILSLLLSCQSQPELIDGWYTETYHGIKLHLEKTPDDCCDHFIDERPFIDFRHITGIEVNRDPNLDESIEVFFKLNSEGQKRLDRVLVDNYGQEIFFVFDSSLSNFTRIDSGYYKFGQLSMTLGFSDYSNNEIETIIEKIKEKTKPNNR